MLRPVIVRREFTEVVCDTCGATSTPEPDMVEAKARARHFGWLISEKRHLCFKCRPAPDGRKYGDGRKGTDHGASEGP